MRTSHSSAQTMRQNRQDRTGKGGYKKKQHGPVVTKKKFLKALKDSGGIKAIIARRCGVTYCCIALKLNRPDWADMLEAYNAECESLVDDAEKTVRYMIKQRANYTVASNTARWYLERRKAQTYKPRAEVTIEGGETPLHIESSQKVVVIDPSHLPLALRRSLLNDSEKANEVHKIKKVSKR